MISLKKYLDSPSVLGQVVDAEPGLLPTAMDCYRAVLSAIGRSAVQGCPALGQSLEQNLQGLERRLSFDLTAESMKRTEAQIEIHLQEWAGRTAKHLKAKTDEVKELLLTLAKTAESVGNRDKGYTRKLQGLTARIETIADLDDLTEMRSSLVRNVTELKTSIDQMTRESQQLVDLLRAEVSAYENKLKEVESLALTDELTGVANRRSIEDRIHWNIENNDKFCVLMLDLNDFKQVNDQFGHQAGDDLLKQFAAELRMRTRTCDLVGRWGGDEFILILECEAAGARSQIERINEWVFGNYKIPSSHNKVAPMVQMGAAIGLAEWRPGETMEQVIARADAAMYKDKQPCDQQNVRRPA